MWKIFRSKVIIDIFLRYQESIAAQHTIANSRHRQENNRLFCYLMLGLRYYHSSMFMTQEEEFAFSAAS